MPLQPEWEEGFWGQYFYPPLSFGSKGPTVDVSTLTPNVEVCKTIYYIHTIYYILYTMSVKLYVLYIYYIYYIYYILNTICPPLCPTSRCARVCACVVCACASASASASARARACARDVLM